MHLTPKEEDRLLLFLAAELARKRRAKGLRLTYAEARALIADEVVEAARAGASVSQAAEIGAAVLTDDDILPGVRVLVGTVQVEGFFEDGQKLVTIHDPIRPGKQEVSQSPDPGEVIVAEGDIELNVGREVVELSVSNTGDRPVQVGSHFHFFEVNRALRFDRARAYGMHLDIASGTAVRFEPGEERKVVLTQFGGARNISGLNDMTDQPTDRPVSTQLLARLRENGFADSGEGA